MYLSSESCGIHVKHPNCKRSVFTVVFGDLDLQRLLSPTVQFCLWGHSLAPTDAFINVRGTKTAFSVEFSAFPEEEGSSLARGRGMEAQVEVQTYTVCLFKCIIPTCFATNKLCFILKRHNRSPKCGWLFPQGCFKGWIFHMENCFPLVLSFPTACFLFVSLQVSLWF